MNEFLKETFFDDCRTVIYAVKVTGYNDADGYLAEKKTFWLGEEEWRGYVFTPKDFCSLKIFKEPPSKAEIFEALDNTIAEEEKRGFKGFVFDKKTIQIVRQVLFCFSESLLEE